MAIQLLINCKLRRSQSSLHTARRCIPNVPTYISNDHEHQNGTINSSLVGVIIGDWKFYNHQGLCFNSKRSIRVGLMDITCGLMISQDRNLIRLFVTLYTVLIFCPFSRAWESQYFCMLSHKPSSRDIITDMHSITENSATPLTIAYKSEKLQFSPQLGQGKYLPVILTTIFHSNLKLYSLESYARNLQLILTSTHMATKILDIEL
ncbi:hypothetical protein H8356DRAFT_1333546 [Neocallimastix lanati (nom. inval.)]|nr:hypothetical protein H8356DRAFT_1333546 [Neocallimastix sp. JGI-2020a]